MAKKDVFSQKAVSIIESVWISSNLLITLIVEDTYHLNPWMCFCIGVIILIIGKILIRKFIKVNE